LYPSPNIIKATKESRKMSWMGHVARMGRHTKLLENLLEKAQLEDLNEPSISKKIRPTS
jgi:hypothetical protein